MQICNDAKPLIRFFIEGSVVESRDQPSAVGHGQGDRTDSKTDIALIKVDGNDFPFVKFANHQARIGDWVIAVGNPFGLGGTVTAGVVSARGRDIGSGPYDDYIQSSATN